MIAAVILAGGLGTRLRPLTDRLPKALVRVQGKPFLELQLESLRGGGVREVLLLVGYRARQIEEVFGDGRRLGLELRYSREETPRGTGGALQSAAALLPDDFLLLNGDTFLPVPYAVLVEEYRRRQTLGLLAAYGNPQKEFANNLALGTDRMVTGYGARDPAGMTHVDAGVSVFSKRILDFIAAGEKVSLEEEVYPLLIERRQLAAFPTQERFYDIGSFAGLEAFEAGLAGTGEKRP